MSSVITVKNYPLSVGEKNKRYTHPQRKLHYGKKTLINANKVLSESLIKMDADSANHKELLDFFKSEILRQWEDNSIALNMLKRSLMWLENKHPLSKLRLDGTPLIFHFLEPAYRLTVLHSDADTVIATLHHDDFEDGYCSETKLYSILCGKNPDAPTKILAQCAIWQVNAMTNPYKTNLQKASMSKPLDWKREDVLSYMRGRMLAEDRYLYDLISLEIVDPLVIKVSGDRLHNVQSPLNPKTHLDKRVYSFIKAFRSLNWAKKIHYATSYYTLRAIETGLDVIDATFKDAQASFSIPSFMDINIPIDLYSLLDYHKTTQSFEQDEHESTFVEIAGVRAELSADTLRKLPYSGRAAAVLFCPPKAYYNRIDSHPLEIQLPRRIGFGNPASDKGWEQLRSEDLRVELQGFMNKNGLVDFEVKIIPTFLPGKMGMDTAMFRLDYSAGSLYEYIKSQKNPTSTYEKIILSVRDAVYDLIELKFHRTISNYLSSGFEVPPNTTQELFKKIKDLPPRSP